MFVPNKNGVSEDILMGFDNLSGTDFYFSTRFIILIFKKYIRLPKG